MNNVNVYPQGEGGSPTERTHFVHAFCVQATPQLLLSDRSKLKYLDKCVLAVPQLVTL